ncbi:hypothetical protein D9M69_533520 [compost metagenome]
MGGFQQTGFIDDVQRASVHFRCREFNGKFIFRLGNYGQHLFRPGQPYGMYIFQIGAGDGNLRSRLKIVIAYIIYYREGHHPKGKAFLLSGSIGENNILLPAAGAQRHTEHEYLAGI